MNCPNCLREITISDAKFCPNCGEKLVVPVDPRKITRFRCVKGDIVKDRLYEAIVTLINPVGDWFGGVDRAIKGVAGNQYHNQARMYLATTGLKDKQVIIAKKKEIHGGFFQDVIFVVDDLISPLNELVSTALYVAKEHGYSQIAFPVMRTGAVLGRFEKGIIEVVDQMKMSFIDFRYKSNMRVYIVATDATTQNIVESRMSDILEKKLPG